jgi:hypothetical protein
MIDWPSALTPLLLVLCGQVGGSTTSMLAEPQPVRVEAHGNLIWRFPSEPDGWNAPSGPAVTEFRSPSLVPGADRTEAVPELWSQNRDSDQYGEIGQRGSPVTIPADRVGPSDWPGERTLQVPIAGPLFVFGQVRSEGDWVPPIARLLGNTGVGWKLPVLENAGLQACCGPELIYGDPVRPEHAALPVSAQGLRLEVVGRWAPLGYFGLECHVSGGPALTSRDRGWIDHEVRVVLPVGRAGQVRLGARYSWESSGDARPEAEGSLLYGGFRLEW